LTDKALVELARRAPEDSAALGETAGVPASFRQTHEKTILRTVKRAMSTRAWREPMPRRRALSDRQKRRADRLWAQVKQRCEQANVAVGLVASRHDFADLARAAIRKRSTEAFDGLLSGWRYELLKPIFDELGVERAER
jgi:ribonuclease D